MGANLILSLLATQIFDIHGHCTCMELLILSLALGVYGITKPWMYVIFDYQYHS